MSITAGDVARAALADLGEMASGGQLHALRWVAERYSQLAGRRLKQLRRVGALTIPAAITAGAVTIAQEDTVVTGDPTAMAEWNADLVGRYLQVQRNWYEIAAFDAASLTLELAEPFAETSVTASGYRIVQRYTDLPSDVQFIGTVLHERFFRELDHWSLTELDVTAPERLYVTVGPTVIAEVGENEDGAKKVEIYPYSTITEHLVFTYWARPPEKMQDDTILPGALTVGDMKQGVLVDLKQFKMAQAAADGKVELAAFWRNEYRSQETVWLRVTIPALVKRDQGIEDKVLLLRSLRGVAGRRSIENARDEIWARGRP